MRQSAFSKQTHRRVRKTPGQSAFFSGVVAALLVGTTVWGVPTSARAAENDVALCDLAVSLKLKKVKRSLDSVDQQFRQQWRSQRPDDKLAQCERNYMSNDELRTNRLLRFGGELGVDFVVAPAVFSEKGKVRVSIWVVDIKSKARRQYVVVDLPDNEPSLRSEGANLLSAAIAELSSVLPGTRRLATQAAAPPPSTVMPAETGDGKTLVCDFAVSIKLKGLLKPLGVLNEEFNNQWRALRSQDVMTACKRYFMANDDLRINKMASFGEDAGARFVIAPGVYKDNNGVNHLSVWKIDVANKRKIGDVTLEIPSTAAAIAAQASQVAREAVERAALGASASRAAPPQQSVSAPIGPKVALCDAAVSVKLKDVISDIQALEFDMVRLWQAARPTDQTMSCRRYFMEKPAIRLNKLVSFGEKANVDYVFAPAVYEENDQSTRMSVWIVDVAAQRQLAEVIVPLPAKGHEIRQNGPAAMVRPLTELRAVLEAKIAGQALPRISTYAPPPAASNPTLVSTRPTANGTERTEFSMDDTNAAPRAAPLVVAQSSGESLAPGPNAVGSEPLTTAHPTILESVTSVSPVISPDSPSEPVMRMVMVNSAGALLGAGLAATATAAGLTGVAMSLNQFKDQARLEEGDYEQLRGMVMGVSAGADASWLAAGVAGFAGVALLSGTLLWVEE